MDTPRLSVTEGLREIVAERLRPHVEPQSLKPLTRLLRKHPVATVTAIVCTTFLAGIMLGTRGAK